MVRLYANTIGNGSFARIGRGMTEGLLAHESLAGLVPLDAMDEWATYDGPMAEVGVVSGPPPQIERMSRLGRHEERLLLLAPNSTWIPQWLIEEQRILTGFIVPSEWARSVLAGQTSLPVGVWQHGLDAGFSTSAEDAEQTKRQYDDGYFTVSHLTSTRGERKGTVELIRAWASLCGAGAVGKHPTLRLVVTEWTSDDVAAVVEDAARGNPGIIGTVLVSTRRNFSAEAASKFYRSSHVVCQPSRGEGFGMVPLEARACGTPVVATVTGTGHSEHMSRTSPGVVAVDVGEMAPIDDGPGALAPSLDVGTVAAALGRAYEDWPALSAAARANAAALGAKWSWKNVTGDWLTARRSGR